MKIYLLSTSLLVTSFITAQSSIQWDKSLGGSNDDEGFDVKPTGDGGFIVVGTTTSADDDVTVSYGGGRDVWVVKTDADGNIVWQKTYGGSGDDAAISVVESPDGNWVICGSTTSTDGDITANNGDRDVWLLKIDNTGTLLWQHTYGGDSADVSNSVINTSDGGFLVTGNSKSYNDDLTANYGLNDIWVIKTDADGNLIWQKNYGGSRGDFGFSARELADGYVFVGYTDSNDNDVTGNHADTSLVTADFWAVKINFTGNIIWQRCYGGTYDEYASDIEISSTGTLFIVGSAESNDGDVTGHYGMANKTDLWFIETDTSGTLLNQKNIGGSSNDDAKRVKLDEDGGLIIAGESESDDFDVSGHHGSTSSSDFWIVKLAADGTLLWQRSFGGLQKDIARTIYPLGDDEYIAVGSTKSTSGDVTSHHGTDPNYDYWLVKLASCNPQITVEPPTISTCEGQDVTLTVETNNGVFNYTWYFIGGPTVTTLTPELNLTDISIAYSHDYYVVVNGACSSDTSATATLDISDFPDPDISPSTTQNLCTLPSVTFNTTLISPGYNYQWYKDGAPITGATSTSYTTSTVGYYQIKVSDAFGCSDISDSVQVVNEAPVATVTATDPLNICNTGAVSLTTSAGAGYSFQWYQDAIAISGATSNSYTATVPGNYYVIVDAAGCVDTSDVVIVTDETPVAVADSSGSLDLCSQNNVTLTTPVTGTGYTYQWLESGVVLLGAIATNLVVADTGYYSVIVYNSYGCSDTSSVLHVYNSCDTINAVTDYAGLSSIVLFPNPSGGIFEIQSQTINFISQLHIEIMNNMGEKIFDKIIPVSSTSVYQSFDMSDKSDGLYTMKLSSGNNVAFKNFVLSK